jgi:hypothetical protein
MDQQSSTPDGFFWHESAGARILLPNELSVVQPFPQLYAKAAKRIDSIIVTITNYEGERSITERLIQYPPRVDPSVMDLKIVRNGPIASPFIGKELFWEIVVIEHPTPTHAFLQLLELDTAKGVFAVIRGQGERLFEAMESSWEKVINSFTWNSATGVFLKFDGDEFIHRKRHQKKPTRKKAASSPKLPARLRYLQPIVDELLALPPEEIHEDVDLPDVGRLFQRRTHGLPHKKASEKLSRDRDALKAWIEEDVANRANAEFLRGMLEYAVLHNILRPRGK